MANNNIRLDIDVRGKGLLEAIKSTDSLEKNMKRLSDTYGRGGASYQQYYRAVQKLAVANGKSTKELLNHGKALREDTKAAKNYKDMLKQADTMNKVFDHGIKQQAQSLHRLKMTTDISYKSVYNLQSAKKVLKEEVRQGRMTVEQYVASMRKYIQTGKAASRTSKNLTDSTNRLTYAARKHAAAQAFSGKKINRMGANLQQAGYQIGDFAVQVQGGTNVMVALGQQGAQLLGIFGAGGALAGAALAIGTALIAPLMRGEKAVKGLNEEIKALKKELAGLQNKPVISDNLSPLLEELEGIQLEILKLEGLRAKFSGVYADFVKAGIEDNVMAVGTLSEIVSLEENINRLEGRREDINKRVREYQGAILGIRKEYADQEKTSLEREISLLTLIKQFGEDSLAVQELKKQQALAIYEAELKSQKYHPSIIKNLLDMKSLAIDLANALGDAANNTKSLAELSGNVDFYDPRGREVGSKGSGVTPKDRPNPQVSRLGGGVSRAGSVSGRSLSEELNNYLESLRRQVNIEKELVGISGEKRDVEEAIINARLKYSGLFNKDMENELRLILTQTDAYKERSRVIEDAESKRKQLASFIKRTLEDGLMSIVEGTKSVKESFKDMARSIIKELYRVLVMKEAVASLTKVLGFSEGGVFSGGSQVQAFANGGVVSRPTLFPMSGGKTGLMGEAGAEAIMPLKRGRNGKLGVQMEGSQSPIVIHQNFNLSANGDESVKKIIAQAAPQIANMTQKQIMDSRRRGGSMKSAFG